MPAERSKSSKRSGVDGNQLVWTVPVEPTTIEYDSITSISNATAITFDDGPPPLVDAPPCEYILFPPTDGSAPRRPAHSKKKPDDHIPRPPNAFILFRSSFIKGQHVPTEVETNHSTLSKIIGLTWKNLPNDERQFWHSKAKAALDEHKRKFPQYAFKPTQSRGKGGTEKRKVREVGPKDHKRCAKIAELLVEGKKGQELDEAIQEFDKHHVPEIVTRFEAPLTAKMYRRSSSAPIPEEELARPSARKYRSSSSQPTMPAEPLSSSPHFLQETKQEPLPESSYMSSFDQFSFLQPSPSFDLNTFSFDHSSPLSAFPCSPIAEPMSPLDNSSLFNVNDMLNTNAPSSLTIDTSYLGMDDWTRCSSPMSAASSSGPATPSFIDSPSPDTYSTLNDTISMDSFERSLTKSFGDFTSQQSYELYPNSADSQFTGGFINADSPSEYPSFDHHHSKVHMASQDLDFSAFMMASLPEYSL